MKRFLVAAFILLLFGVGAKTWYEESYTIQGKDVAIILGSDIESKTVAEVQAIACDVLTDPDLYYVTDGDSATDCATGSGTFGHYCKCTDFEWVDSGIDPLEAVRGFIRCFSRNISNPVTTDKYVYDYHTEAFTVTEVGCVVDPADPNGESVTIDIYETDASGDEASNIEASIVCVPTGTKTLTGIDDASVAADVWVGLDVTAKTGTVTMLQFHYCGTY